MISIKFHEVNQPEIALYEELADYSISRDDLILMETRVLLSCEFRLNYVTVDNFFGIVSPYLPLRYSKRILDNTKTVLESSCFLLALSILS